MSSVYNANGTLANSTDARGNTTYYGYDGLNRQTAQWSPVGAGLFEYSGKAYDKAGRAVTATRARGTVANGVLPTAWLVTTSYAYNAGGQLEQVTTSGGAKTTYTYDDNGNVSSKNMYYTSSSYNQETYQYNNMDRLWTKVTYADYRDIYGYNSSTLDLALTTIYTYDLNGYPLTMTNPNDIVTTYTYDQMNRLRTTSQPGVDENNAPVTITTETTYNWAGNALTTVDERGYTTSYAYDQRGFLSKVTDARGGVRYFTYDRAGRKAAEVSPNNYSSSLALSNMPRTEYA